MLRRVLIALLVGLAVLGAVFSVRVFSVMFGSSSDPERLLAQLRFLESSLDRGDAERMQELFPEGSYFLRSLTALAGAAVPGGDLDRARALRDSLDQPESVAVFGSGMVPEHGIFQAGWALAVSVELARASGDEADAADVRRRAAVVDAALRRSPSGFLEGYPGQYWPCDSVVAASALAEASGLLREPAWRDTVRTWRSRVRVAADPATGLLPHRVDARGRVAEGPRGSSQSIIQAFWPAIVTGLDNRPDLRTWLQFRESFVVREAGLVGVREYPLGVKGDGDVDSGPLVRGVSASASAVTLAAARAVGDEQLTEALDQEAEMLGVPLTWQGERRYALGRLPVGDAFLAWARSRPEAPSSALPPDPRLQPAWADMFTIGTLPAVALVALALVRVMPPIRRRRPVIRGALPD